MDREQFDTLTRLVAAKGSRRVALGGLLGAVILGQGPQLTATQCRSKEDKNKRQWPRRHRRDAPRGGDSPTCGLGGQLSGDLLGVECCGPLTCTTSISVVSSCVLPRLNAHGALFGATSWLPAASWASACFPGSDAVRTGGRCDGSDHGVLRSLLALRATRTAASAWRSGAGDTGRRVSRKARSPDHA
jgi:hypothetical protein